MKFINKVIVFVMGLVVIGVATTTIGVVTQPKNVEKNVTFELLENEMLEPGVYNKINDYVVFGNELYDTNLVSVTVNNNELELPTITFDNYNVAFNINFDDVFDNPYITIMEDNTYTTTNYNVGDVITIIFNVEQETPAIIKTLLFLAPLILSASLIGFLAFKKGDE